MINFVQNVSSNMNLNVDSMSKKFQKVLQYLEIPDSEVTIAIISNNEIRELNKIYKGIDEITDVLSFTSNEINPETGKIYLGDIIVSFEKANQQAREKNHSLEFEVLTLVIHGILHLLNYDHSNEIEEKTMFGKQNELLEVIN